MFAEEENELPIEAGDLPRDGESLALSLPQLQATLTRFGYKPGWELRLETWPWSRCCNGTMLMVIAQTTDSTNPSAQIKATFGYSCPPMHSAIEFLHFVRQALWQSEFHEFLEAFTVDGHVLNNPHDTQEEHDRKAGRISLTDVLADTLSPITKPLLVTAVRDDSLADLAQRAYGDAKWTWWVAKSNNMPLNTTIAAGDLIRLDPLP